MRLTDQYDVSIEYSGYPTQGDDVVFRGDLQTREFVVFWLQGERVAAGMNVNLPNVNEQVEVLIRSRAPVDPRLLRDPEVPQKETRAALARRR